MARREGAGHKGAQHARVGRAAKLARQLSAIERLAATVKEREVKE